MNTPDLINGSFELFAGMFVILNCWRLYNDKEVKGISVLSVMFFSLWGFWNIYYYPRLGQHLSFYAGIFVVCTETVWVSQMIYYSKFYKRRNN